MSQSDYRLRRFNPAAMDVSFSNIYSFLITAEEGNISRAAQRLFIGQPSLSKQIMALEEKIGVPLFLRGERTLTLTRQGRHFYERWRELFLAFEADIIRAKELQGSPIEILRLGCFPVLNFHRFLREYTDRLHRAYPELTLELQSTECELLLDRLNSRELDAAFLFADDLPANRDYYEWQIVSRLNAVAVVPSDHPLAGESSVAVERLSGERLLLADLSYESMLLRRGITKDNLRHVGSYLTAYTEAECGHGIALGVRSLFPVHNERVCVVELEGEFVEIAAVWNKNAPGALKEIFRSFTE